MKLEELKRKPFNSLINVSQLLKEPIGSSRSYHVKEVVDQQVKDSIEGKLALLRSGQGILLRGQMVVKVELMCCRCLNIFLCPISFNMEEEFLPTVDVTSGLPLSLSEQLASFTIDDNHMLDLGEAIRQYTLLNLPMKPLCRPDCAGTKGVSL